MQLIEETCIPEHNGSFPDQKLKLFTSFGAKKSLTQNSPKRRKYKTTIKKIQEHFFVKSAKPVPRIFNSKRRRNFVDS